MAFYKYSFNFSSIFCQIYGSSNPMLTKFNNSLEMPEFFNEVIYN